MTSDSVVDFKPTSSSVSTFHATHDFDSCQLLPWLKSPDIRSASSYTTPSLILTPGTYTIEANLIKNDWEFDFHLMDYQTFLPGDSIQATAGGDFSIETFETDLPSYLPGESIIFTLSINDHYGHRLFYSRNDSGQGNFPYLVIKNPDNEIVHEASTYFYQKTVQLDSNAVAGTYSAALSFETGPHQGELFETTFFDVEAKDPCLADFNGDGDVDGQDLANLIDNPWFMGVADFSAGFGMEDCTNN